MNFSHMEIEADSIKFANGAAQHVSVRFAEESWTPYTG
jgi:hypothetical protein